MKKRVFIGLGSNLGNKRQNLSTARNLITRLAEVEIVKVSSCYLTSPWGKTDQAAFINQVMAVDTTRPALDLLHDLLNIEIKMGRQRCETWGPRIIDLDILVYGDEIIDSKELKIPHPYMHERLFVLIPLAEIEPDFIFPGGGQIKEVLASAVARDSESTVKRI
jgi:2-amino-4-hydroxy-6-hydroxymethyldihydropteridine diphosphokinase